MPERNPQAPQMADESMVRTLAAQIEAIWPQEQALLERYRLPDDCRIVDVGCGTGEFSRRIAERCPHSAVLGVDVLPASVQLARERHARCSPRLQFAVGDAFHLDLEHDSFDLGVCRHMIQAVPEPERVLAELARVTRPGGWLHVLAEDYGMLHMMSGRLDPDELWRKGPIDYTARTHTDARIGRKTWSLLRRIGLEELRVDYVLVDTLRVPRKTFASILIAWRDGYAAPLAQGSDWPENLFREHFDEIIASVQNPEHYAIWFVPVVSGRKPR